MGLAIYIWMKGSVSGDAVKGSEVKKQMDETK